MAVFKLKGHEKFPLREGWLNKGLNGIEKDNRIFSSSDATDRLGVGNNMVKAIRYWMQAFGLVDENRKIIVGLSDLGKTIRKNDEYIEDLFTLWILHSYIAKNKERATIWYLFFNKCGIEEFTKEEITTLLKRELIVYAGTDKFPEASLKDDIDVLLNMYSKDKGENDPEDKNTCPFAMLGLLKKEGSIYVKRQPELRKFSEWIVLYEIINEIHDEKSISIDTIAELLHSLYHISRVNANSILDKLDNLKYIRVDRTAGLDMIYLEKEMSTVEVLEEYYKNR